MIARILIVDDEEKFADYLHKRLSNRDYEVAVALSGEEALEKIKNAKFDVVILDVLMPGMDGIETLRSIKKIKPLTEVIMLTGHASVESGVEGMKLGAYDYLMKPCDIDELVSKLNKAYARKKEQEERIMGGQGVAHSLLSPLGVQGLVI